MWIVWIEDWRPDRYIAPGQIYIVPRQIYIAPGQIYDLMSDKYEYDNKYQSKHKYQSQ